MALSVKYVSYFEVVSDATVIRGGSLSPVSITAGSDILFDVRQSLANNTTTVLFDDTESAHPADFDFLFIVSTQDIYLELTTDQNAGVGDELYTLPLAANVPFVLARDDSYANYTANFGGGTLDTIERIRARNISGSTAAIRTVLAT
jgi:hypothetical protein